MFGSDALEVAIGLVLVYLLISILLTSVSEAIEARLKTRASDLEKALLELMQGDTGLLQKFYTHPLIFGLYQGSYMHPDAAAAAGPPDAAAARRLRTRNLPSYIPREMFSGTMLHLVAGGGTVNSRFEQAFDALTGLVGADTGRIRKELEGWYDAAMDRASGWYKRRTQARLLLLGLGIAVFCNVNSVTIAHYLATHPVERAAAVKAAEDARLALADEPVVQPPAPAAAGAAELPAAPVDPSGAAATPPAGADQLALDERVAATALRDASLTGGAPAAAQGRSAAEITSEYRARLAQLGLPIGWSAASVAETLSIFPTWRGGADPGRFVQGILAVLLLAFGYLATAFAVTLGAPFWFDLLNKLMVVRSTVKPREKSPDEPPVDGAPAAGAATTSGPRAEPGAVGDAGLPAPHVYG